MSDKLTRRSFFAALAAPVVAPTLPRLIEPNLACEFDGFIQTLPLCNNTTGTLTVSTLPSGSKEHMEKMTRELIESINKEVERGCRISK